jgi:hypothetical protein
MVGRRGRLISADARIMFILCLAEDCLLARKLGAAYPECRKISRRSLSTTRVLGGVDSMCYGACPPFLASHLAHACQKLSSQDKSLSCKHKRYQSLNPYDSLKYIVSFC